MAEGQQKADAVVGNGVKAKRAGETPRQQIRKAKATTRRQVRRERRSLAVKARGVRRL